MDKIKYLEKALDDIARGMCGSEMPSLDQDKYKFRAEMWSWSQKRARQGLAFCDTCKGEGSIDTPHSGSDPSCPDCDGEGFRQSI